MLGAQRVRRRIGVSYGSPEARKEVLKDQRNSGSFNTMLCGEAGVEAEALYSQG